MSARPYVCAVITALALCAAARAQAPPPAPVQSFRAGILITDWKARLDSLAVDLQNAPDSRAYIVAYSEKYKLPGWPLRRGNQAIGFLTETRGLDESRVSLVSGGFRESAGFEFWLVGPGERLPFTPPDIYPAFAGERSPVIFDRYFLFSPWEDWGEDGNLDVYQESHGRFEHFVKALRADPGLRGCVITYAARRDRRGTDRRLAAAEKKAILTTQAIAADRVFALAGGTRPHKTVELWLVPPGAELPKPTPDARRARRRRRR